jgi:tRNA (uracil-5-)-methyltransferase TRM9
LASGTSAQLPVPINASQASRTDQETSRMNTALIRQLNLLNQQFYQKVGQSFSDTRQHPWPGWEVVWSHLQTQFEKPQPARVLDLGCGNGRFAKFLASKTKHFSYLGIDQDEQLLEFARQELEHHVLDSTTLLKLDLIDALLTNDHLPQVTGQFDVIVLLGVLHHVPSHQLRQKLLQILRNLLTPTGTLVVTCWQFQHSRNLMTRQVSPATLAVDSAELEPNDYFLTWEREVPATRYCHLIDQSEQDQLVEEVGLKKISRFVADGFFSKANEYLVLTR